MRLLEALGPKGPFAARNRQDVPDVTGTVVAELSLVPRLFVQRAMTALRKAEPLPVDERAAALAKAASIFTDSTIGGLTHEEYLGTVSRVSGMPVTYVRAAASVVASAAADATKTVEHARPLGAVTSWRDPVVRQGHALWARRGDVFAVHAAGNHPGIHAVWLEALALGYRVAVRPSRREPFTAHRLISALRAAGFGDDQVVYLPTDHAVADEVIAGADLAMVYGGDDVVTKYAGSTKVLPQGPGRSKILLADGDTHLDTVVSSISSEAGMACVNTTAVFVAGDPAPVAEAIAERLAALPSVAPDDEAARLPVLRLAAAQGIDRAVKAAARGATALTGGVEDLGDGSAVLRPAVFVLDRADAEQTRVEMGFPCVWVAPWSPGDGVAPLRDTLVITAFTEDEALVDRLVVEPSISNVYVGEHPTHWMRPHVPHDGFLAEFLMRTKGVVRD
ncbi:aldehyde dehydrogenase family protein [Amycolatopsis sp. NBC_00355]|uniref:aldehyde dehydrogenase family protein n=1 Tax=Amycolatopsis sp. NBC_00355 TaxID=2975957 RepID=UPI002E26A5CD